MSDEDEIYTYILDARERGFALLSACTACVMGDDDFLEIVL